MIHQNNPVFQNINYYKGRLMGQKYQILARNFTNETWAYSAQTNWFIIHLFQLLQTLQYSVVDITIRKDQ